MDQASTSSLWRKKMDCNWKSQRRREEVSEILNLKRWFQSKSPTETWAQDGETHIRKGYDSSYQWIRRHDEWSCLKKWGQDLICLMDWNGLKIQR